MPLENYDAYPVSGLNRIGIAGTLGVTGPRLVVAPQPVKDPVTGPAPYPVRPSDIPGVEELRKMVAAGDLTEEEFRAAVKQISRNAGFVTMSEDELQERISGLPLLTQQQLLAEMRTQDKMRTRIANLLAQPNPQRAIFLDQLKTVAQVYKPGSYPGHTSAWPVLQGYVHRQMAQQRAMAARGRDRAQLEEDRLAQEARAIRDERLGRRRQAERARNWASRLDMQGYTWTGRADEIPVVRDRSWGLFGEQEWIKEVKGWWGDQGKDLFESYVGDDLASAAKNLVGLDGDDREAERKAEEVRRQAVLEQQRALEEAAPEVTREDEPEKKGGWGWAVAAAAGLAALVGLGVALTSATRGNPFGPLPRRVTRRNAGRSLLIGPVGGLALFLALRHLLKAKEEKESGSE